MYIYGLKLGDRNMTKPNRCIYQIHGIYTIYWLVKYFSLLYSYTRRAVRITDTLPPQRSWGVSFCHHGRWIRWFWRWELMREQEQQQLNYKYYHTTCININGTPYIACYTLYMLYIHSNDPQHGWGAGDIIGSTNACYCITPKHPGTQTMVGRYSQHSSYTRTSAPPLVCIPLSNRRRMFSIPRAHTWYIIYIYEYNIFCMWRPMQKTIRAPRAVLVAVALQQENNRWNPSH